MVRAHFTRGRTPPLVGRREDLAAVREMLGDVQSDIVTVVGPPGVGKTRLAREVLARQAGTFVPFADARTRDDVVAALSTAFDVVVTGPSLEDVVAELAPIAASRGVELVVLDNAEHLVEHLREVVESWPDDGRPAFLVTSQRPLNAEGERVHELRPLSSSGAIELFRQLVGSEAFDDDEREDVATLVDRLDRLPLALELAAARSAVLAPADLLARLDRRLSVLKSRGEPGRHATLENAIGWAWDALNDSQQSLLEQIVVFRGEFDVDAAEAVLRATGDVLDVLQDLVERSLLYVAESRRRRTFDVYESVRAFVEAHATEDRELMRRHAVHFVATARGHLAGLGTNARSEHVAGLRRHRQNLQAVLDRGETLGESDLVVEAAVALMTLLYTVGPATSAREVFEEIEPRLAEVNDELATRALYALGRAHIVAHDLDAAERVLGRTAESGGHLESELLAMRAIGGIHASRGHFDEATRVYEHAIQRARDAGDERLAAIVDAHYVFNALGRLDVPDVGIRRLRQDVAVLSETDDRVEELHASNFLGTMLFSATRYNEAREIFDEVEDAARAEELFDVLIVTLTTSADQRLHTGDVHGALRALEEARELCNTTGDLNWRDQIGREVARTLIDLGELGRAEAMSTGQLSWFRTIGREVLQAASLIDLAAIAHERKRFDVAGEYYAEARELRSGLMEAHVRLGEGLLALELGDFQAAHDHLERASGEGLPTGFETRVEHLVSSLLEVATRRFLDDDGDRDVVRAFRERREAVGDRLTPLQADLVDWVARIAGGDLEARSLPESWLGRILARIAESVDGGEEVDEEAPVLVVGPEARWVRLPDDTVEDLSRRGPPRRILQFLVDALCDDPGAAHSVDQLVDVGWPGQEGVDIESLRRRAYVAVQTLRSLGFDGWLVTGSEGYLLDPRLDLVRSEVRVPPESD